MNRLIYLFFFYSFDMDPSTIDTSLLEDAVYQKLTGCEDIQNRLYEYVKAHEIPCTENENGIYLNLSAISREVLQDIYEKLCFYETTGSIFSEDKIEHEICPPKPISHVTEISYRPVKLTALQKRLLNLI